MSNILQIGFTTEGTTDVRFLKNIIYKTFQSVAFECQTNIEVYEPELIEKSGDTFNEQVLNLTIKHNYFHVICVHRDSDSPSADITFENSINPAFSAAISYDGNNCKILVPLVPIQMTEAWMLVNKELLKNKIGTILSDQELGLPARIKQIEGISDPKGLINNAIRIAKNSSTKRRRRNFTISSLYSPISQELEISELEKLSSYKSFKDSVRAAFEKLNYVG
jgi:hypothetical protein